MGLENTLALNVLPKTSITHLQMSMSIKEKADCIISCGMLKSATEFSFRIHFNII